MTRRPIVAALALAALVACKDEPKQIHEEDLVIALVDGVEVRRGMFDTYLRYGIQLTDPTDAAQSDVDGVTAVEYTDDVHSRLLDWFLVERALAQRARSTGITFEESALDRFARSTGIGSLQSMEDGMPLTQREYLRGYLEDSLLVKQLLQRHAGSEQTVTDADALAWYEANIERFTEPTRYHLHQIHVETLLQSRELEQAVGRSRERFLERSSESSDEESEEQGRDLGWWSVDALPESFVVAIGNLAVGSISKVFQDPDGGYNLLLIEEMREGHIRPFAEVRGAVIATLQRERRYEASRSFRAQVREATEIEIVRENLGFNYVLPTVEDDSHHNPGPSADDGAPANGGAS